MGIDGVTPFYGKEKQDLSERWVMLLIVNEDMVEAKNCGG
jgi:hypothetical protein